MTGIPTLFDTELLARRRSRAWRQFGSDADFLLQDTVTELIERLAMVTRRFPTCVEIGGHSGPLARALATRKGTDHVIRLEQSQVLLKAETAMANPEGAHTPAAQTRSRRTGAIFDPECLPLRPQSVDLIVSPLFLHWVNDLPGALLQIRQALVPDGLFLGTLLGRETLRELKESFLRADSELTGGASPRIAPMPELKDMGSLMQRAGFTLPVVDQDSLTVRYGSIFALMQDLRRMGATNSLTERSRTPMRRQTLMRAAEIYHRDFADPDGKIRATFQILSLSGWSPHESQQKPLKPGSAKHALSDFLKDKSPPASE